MFIGHFAVGFAAKRAAPRTSLATLIAAALLLDLIWPLMLWAGLEQVRIDPGNTAFTPLDFESYPWSHSLLMTIGWAALAATLYRARTKYTRGAAWVGIAVTSHWLLDFISHRPDMPLQPWGGPRVGLGLWNSIPATATTEIAMFAAGLALYLNTTRARSTWGHISLWGLVLVLALLYAGNMQGTPPPSIQALKIVSTVMPIFFFWVMWIDRTRTERSKG